MVPHWTAPLFKVVKWKTYPQEYLVALKSGDNLIKNPDLVFPPDMVTYLLQYLHKRHPQTVDEALAARGGVEGIRTDLIELVRTGPLTDLRYLLDSLAKYPGVPSKQAAAQARMDQASARELFIDHSALLLPRPAQAQTSLLDTPGLELYKKAGVLTPLVKQEIKIYLGSGLFEKFITSDGELTPALQQTLDRLQGELYRRFGVPLPHIRFVRAKDNQISNSFRIEMMNQTDKDPEAKPIAVTLDVALQKLMAELRLRCEAWRTWYLSAEMVHGLLVVTLPEDFRDWLKTHYLLSDADLKRILRVRINSRKDGQTLRYSPWLLTSLTFWLNLAGDHRDTMQLEDFLRETQKARLGPPSEILPKSDLGDLVKRGLVDLNNGNYESAARSFGVAVKIDRAVAESTFLALFARQPFPEDFQGWLATRYSLTDTDLKIILRVLINPGKSGEAAGPDGQTLRYPSWLLSSLTFWLNLGDDPRNAKQLGEYLRMTQAARLSPPPAVSPEGEVGDLVNARSCGPEQGKL